MSKPSYYELLRDPRWQRKRLEVMQAADFACKECGSRDRTLNVHHTFYERGRAPWEYEAEHLRCLCEGCHQITEQELAEIRRLVGSLDDFGRRMVRGYARALAWYIGNSDLIALPDVPTIVGVGNAFNISQGDVWDASEKHGRTHVDGNDLVILEATRRAEGR